MVKRIICIEGGGASKDQQIHCREAFRKLFDKCGFTGRKPKLIPCGSRNDTFSDFKTAIAPAEPGDFVAMLIDSEDPVADVEATWAHLKTRDAHWIQPPSAADEHVLFMTTCMETWIVADRAALGAHYGKKLQESALPPLVDLEKRNRHDVQDKLVHATRDCSNAYAKGKRSFEVLSKVSPDVLKKHLPSFGRVVRILSAKL